MSASYNRKRMLLMFQVQQAEAVLAQREWAHTGHGLSLLRPSVFRIWSCTCSRSRDAGMSSGAIFRGLPARAAGSYRVRYEGKYEKRYCYRSYDIVLYTLVYTSNF